MRTGWEWPGAPEKQPADEHVRQWLLVKNGVLLCPACRGLCDADCPELESALQPEVRFFV